MCAVGSGPASVRAASRFSSEGGQAVVELAMALPLLVALAILVFVGGRALTTSVALTDAARAGAVAAAGAVARGQSAQAVDAAIQAAQAEGLALSCTGEAVPSSCVAVTVATGESSGEQMEVVTVYDQVDTGIPGFSNLQVSEQAAATP